jgi:hypothetical protein
VLHVLSVPHVRCFRHVTALSQALDKNHQHVAAFLRSAGAIDGLGGHDDPYSYSSFERMKPRKLHDGHPDCPLCKEKSLAYATGQAGHGDSTAGPHCS